MNKKIYYRPEIDGLRAVAVIAVVLYHAEFYLHQNLLFKGGFLGVDIFFVISGYLITNILYDEYSNTKTISIKNFYKRRAKRILPALFFLIFIITIISLFILPPITQVTFVKSALSSIFFVSNFFFFQNNDDYFLDSSDQMQLLHTWSLSVEEQFYLFFPIIFLYLLKANKKLIFYYILLATILSLVLCVILSFSSNPKLASANFYLFPSRAWELFVGSLISIIIFNRKYNFSYLLSSLIVLVGLILILYPICYFDAKSMSLPSHKTLLPILGTLMIITVHDKNFFYEYFLRLKFVVFLGLISYSLYLWHFPLFSLSNSYFFLNVDELNTKIIIFIISLIISTFSFYFIEKPFRYNKNISVQLIIKWSLIYIVIFFIIFFTIIFSKGLKFAFGDFYTKYPNYIIDNNYLQKKWRKPLKGYYFIGSSNLNKKNKKNILIVGNSHSIGVYRMFAQNNELYKDFDFSVMRIGFEDFNKEHISNEIINNSDLIILASRWSKKYFNDIEKFKIFTEENNKKLLVFLNRPEFPENINNLTLLDIEILKKIQTNYNFDDKFFEKTSKIYFSKINKEKIEINESLKEYLILKGIDFYDPYKYACNKSMNTCQIVTNNFEKIYFDYGHYTIEGSMYLGKKINLLNKLNQLLK